MYIFTRTFKSLAGRVKSVGWGTMGPNSKIASYVRSSVHPSSKRLTESAEEQRTIRIRKCVIDYQTVGSESWDPWLAGPEQPGPADLGASLLPFGIFLSLFIAILFEITQT